MGILSRIYTFIYCQASVFLILGPAYWCFVNRCASCAQFQSIWILQMSLIFYWRIRITSFYMTFKQAPSDYFCQEFLFSSLACNYVMLVLHAHHLHPSHYSSLLLRYFCYWTSYLIFKVCLHKLLQLLVPRAPCLFLQTMLHLLKIHLI